MTKKSLKLVAALAVLSAVSAASFSAAAAPDETLRALAGYRRWASVSGEPGKINATPVGVSVDASDIPI